MYCGAERPFGGDRGRERGGGEFVSVAAEDDDADAGAGRADVPHGFENETAFGKVAGPGVGGVKAPVAGEGDGADDEFPADAGGFGAAEEVE